MNYRHIYHAGNFADLVKHAILLSILPALQARFDALQVIDTHAGAGLYDLTSAEARASGEAAVARLMADPSAPVVFNALRTAVKKRNPGGTLRQYPGSPLLAAEALRAGDRMIACELRPDDAAVLRRGLGPRDLALVEDGYRVAPARAKADGGLFVLIDPPFEGADDYARAAECARAVLRQNRAACVMIWTPLKDLETFDAFLRRLEGAAARTLVAEARLRPLDDPLRLNGCAVMVLNDPPGAEEDAAAACKWVCERLGEADARAHVWRL